MLSIVFAFVGAGCERGKDSSDELGTLVATLSGAGNAGDVVGLRYSVVPAGVSCGGVVIDERVVPLPAQLGAAGPGDVRKLGDGLFALPAGMIRVCVTPLDGNGEPSVRCRSVSAVANVIAQTTTELGLLSMCDGAAAGTLGSVVALNQPPYVGKLAIGPSRVPGRCQPTTLSFAATDPEGDALQVDWAVVGGPPGARLQADAGAATFSADTAGDYEIRVAATDAVGASVALTFPLHVSASGDFCPVTCAVSRWSEWSACSAVCGGGMRARMRLVTAAPARGGVACPELEETRACNPRACTEVIFVVDTSGGLGKPVHDRLVAALTRALGDSKLLPRDGSVSVGLIALQDAASTVVPLTTITASTVRSLLEGVSRLTRSQGAAKKGAALQAALDAFMAAGHAGANRIAVLVTGGPPSPPESEPCATPAISDALAANDITTHVLGIGPGWSATPTRCLVRTPSDVLEATPTTLETQLAAELTRDLR